MFIIVSNSDATPLYEQIKKQIIEQIVNGKLKPGFMLPSIRSLAKDLEISVITIKRAYEDLEKGGYIVTSHGKGSCVAEAGVEFIKEAKLKEVEKHFDNGISICRDLGMSNEDIKKVFEDILTLE